MTADNWKAWLDDLPLGDDFSEGIGSLQDFISVTAKRAETAVVLVATMKKMREAWENALELGLLPEQHRMSAQILRDDAADAIKAYEATQ